MKQVRGVINTPGDPMRLFCLCADTFLYLLFHLVFLTLSLTLSFSYSVPYPFPCPTLSSLSPIFSLTYSFFSCPLPSPLPLSSLTFSISPNFSHTYFFFSSHLSLTLLHSYQASIQKIFWLKLCLLNEVGVRSYKFLDEHQKYIFTITVVKNPISM